MNQENILNAARRSEQSLCEQIAQWESLEYGVAFVSSQFPDSPAGNQLRDVWLADTNPATAFNRAEAYYAERGLICRRWTPASGQDVAPLDALLLPKGWRRKNLLAMGLTGRETFDSPVDPALRILPARAMPKAYRQVLAECGEKEVSGIEIGVERLNDSRYEAFVAMTDDGPVGRAAYLEAGDIARLADLCVTPHGISRGADIALGAHFLTLARRLLPRITVACINEDDDAARSFFEKCGFTVAGTLAQFDRP